DSVKIILSKSILPGDEEEKIFDGYLKKTGKTAADLTDRDREKIIYFGLTYRQRTLIVSAPDKNDEQEKFLGYGWSNAKGREGIVHKKIGGLLFDNDNRDADNTIAAAVRAAFRGQQLNLPELEKYFRFVTTADLLDFDADNFNKTITLANPDYTSVKYSGDFPLVRLGEHVTQIRGVSYKPNDLRSELNDESIILLRANNINNGKINHDKIQFVSREKVSEAQIIRKGDILISASSGSLEHVGKAALCNESVAGETFGAFCKVIRPTGDLMPEYIALYFSTADYRRIISHLASGANINNLKNEHIDNLKIPLPPADIQIKIVEDFKALDTQLDSLEKNIQQLDADIQAKFAALFDGKNFETRTINELFDLQIGKTPARDNFDYWRDGIYKWISVGDLGKYDRFTGETEEKISQAAVEESGIKIVPANTVIMSFKLTIGRTAITSEAIYTNEAIVAFLCKTKNFFDADYLRIYFQRRDWSSGQMQAVKGITLNKQSIGRTVIPLPPLELQEEFAAYVRACEARKENARQQKENLIREREELVTKYFR
ncbi:MAG: restriction endonuclease subunit S, partial [Selenomonadaceae bacterium]|nr:restriction endonuclease subunit S [Selenomonadaceae bacterium]